MPMQPGDVPATYADVDDLMRDVGFKPSTPIADGVARFIAWYKEYHATVDRRCEFVGGGECRIVATSEGSGIPEGDAMSQPAENRNGLAQPIA